MTSMTGTSGAGTGTGTGQIDGKHGFETRPPYLDVFLLQGIPDKECAGPPELARGKKEKKASPRSVDHWSFQAVHPDV